MLELSEQVVFRYEAFFSSADEYDIAVWYDAVYIGI
jgi:hypothetical protein